MILNLLGKVYTTRDVARKYGITIRRAQALAKTRNVGTQVTGSDIWLFTQAEVELLRPGPTGKPKKV